MTVEVCSDRCRLEDLFIGVEIGDELRMKLRQATDWALSWYAEFRTSAGKSEIPVADLGGVVAAEISPVRAFTWSTRQRHRPGLQFMVSTGRHHGFESLEEQRLLLAVDFTGRARVVVSQPLRLRFDTAHGHRSHVPDFLVSDAEGVCVFDVRPAQRIGESEALAFAATAEAALSAGWGYRVVGGWRRGVVTALDALSAQRRNLPDSLGIQEELLQSVSAGASEFGALVGCGEDVGLRRAHLLHLLWRRRLGVQIVNVSQDLYVANMVGQHGYRPSSDGPPVRYEAIGAALSALADRALDLHATVHMPRIGCGLAGGRWELIEPLIVNHLVRRNVAVTVYDP